MKTYSAYELTIRSAFDLPELPQVDESESPVDVVFQQGEVDPVPESVTGKGGRRVQAEPNECRLSYESYGSFFVESGTEVTFDPVSPDVTTKKAIRRLLENEMLGVLMHQRGRLVLHASAVVIDGSVVLFLGPRGVGKSTTAAAFYQHGYPIMEDDIVSVRMEDGIPMVDAGVPELRLNPDIADVLGFTETKTYADDGGSAKRYHYIDHMPKSMPLKTCYVLQVGETCAQSKIDGPDGLFSLINSTYTQGILSETDRADQHFQQCAAVLSETVFYSLTRSDNIGELSSVIKTVLQNGDH